MSFSSPHSVIQETTVPDSAVADLSCAEPTLEETPPSPNQRAIDQSSSSQTRPPSKDSTARNRGDRRSFRTKRTSEMPNERAFYPSHDDSWRKTSSLRSNKRHVVVICQQQMYDVFTNAPKKSRHLCIERNDEKIKFIARQGRDPTHSLEIASLKWKLENDIFSLYVDKLLPQDEDKRRCSQALQRLGSCFAVKLFEAPWNKIRLRDVAVPVITCDIGDGQYIRARRTKFPIGYHNGERVHITGSKGSHSDEKRDLGLSSWRHWNRYRIQTDPFLQFLRKIEVITARYLYGESLSSGMHSKKVASIIRRPEKIHASSEDMFSFSSTVPSLYGMFVTKFINFKQATGSHLRTLTVTSLNSELEQFEENESFGPDLECGIVDNTWLNDTTILEVQTPAVSTQNDNSSQSMHSEQPLLKSKDSEHLIDLAEEGPSIVNSQLLLNSKRSDRDGSLTSGQQRMSVDDNTSSSDDGDVSSTSSYDTSHQVVDVREQNSGPGSTTSSYYYYNAAHVGKELLSILLFTFAVILAVLTVALDPAGEGNWFKRIEEGVFVLFSLLVPIILAMRSRLTDNLNWLMPKKFREVHSLNDLRNQKKDVDDATFKRLLCTAILVDKDISALFSFENACYKRTRDDGPLVVPFTSEYIGLFKKVWMFGSELCFNRLTGEAFKYFERDVDGRSMLMIERKPQEVDGVIVHTRKRDREFQIGTDPGV